MDRPSFVKFRSVQYSVGEMGKKPFHDLKQGIKIFFFFFVFLHLSYPLCRAEIYQYIDQNGNTFFTNERSAVPKEYRKNMVMIQEDQLPPLHLISDSPSLLNQQTVQVNRWPQKFIFFLLLSFVLAIFLFFVLSKKKFGFALRMVAKLLIMVVISFSIALFLLFGTHFSSNQRGFTPEAGQPNPFLIKRVQKKAGQIEDNLKQQKEVLNAIGSNEQ